MAMEEALLTRLREAARLASISGDRVDWFDRPRADDDAPAATLPAITLFKISPGRDWTMDGPDGLDEPRVQFDCWAERKDVAVALARALLAEMEQPRTVDGWRFHEASLELERWTIDEDAGGAALFRVQMDFTFFHEPEEG